MGLQSMASLLVTFVRQDWIHRQTTLLVYLWITSTWVYLATQRLQQTPARALVCLPLAVMHLLLIPILVDSENDPMSAIPTTGMLSFAAFKLVALAMARGALVFVTDSYWQFVAASCMPVIPETAFAASNASKFTAAGSRRNSITNQITSCCCRVACGIIATAAAHAPGAPRLLVYWLYIYILNMFLGAVTDCYSVFTTAVLGLKLAPCFDRPYLSATFAEFWSQRWNVTTTYLFRVMIYDPIIEGKLLASPPAAAATPSNSTGHKQQHGVVAPVGTATGSSYTHSHLQLQQRTSAAGSEAVVPSPAAAALLNGNSSSSVHTSKTNSATDGSRRGKSLLWRFLGVQATFVFSASWHILLYWLLTGAFGWQWMLFFLLQGPLLVIEAYAQKAARSKGITVPRPVAVVLTNLVLIMIADPLLIAPLVESGFVARGFSQAERLAEQIQRHVGVTLQL